MLRMCRRRKPCRALMEPADVASLYLYLASDLAANITGQSLGVDRGEFLG